jgi:MFS family permease
MLTYSVFGSAQPPDAKGHIQYSVQGPLLGIIGAAYNLGAILAVPVVPWVAQKFGRRWPIFLGSLFQCGGAIIQCFSVNGGYLLLAIP